MNDSTQLARQRRGAFSVGVWRAVCAQIAQHVRQRGLLSFPLICVVNNT
ncbi:hypothetical protein WME94_10720 [Sorangium sp. So ce429]